MDIETLLKKTELFSEISEQALKHLSQQGVERTLPKNEIIFVDGSKGTSCYLLIKGGVKLYKTSPNGQEITVRIINPGDIFAEVILFENNHYPVSAVTVTKSVLFEIPRALFISMLDNRDFRDGFIKFLMKKQRYLTERILYLTSFDVEERFFRFLLDRYGKKDQYKIDISKKEISSAIGTIPETLSRLIQRLKQEGALDWDGSVLKVQEDYLDYFLESE